MISLDTHPRTRCRVQVLAAMFVLFVTGSGAAWSQTALVPKGPDVGAKSYILQDFASGRVLLESNADLTLEPASLTKMMTAYVVFSELEQDKIGLQDMVRVSEKAWKTGGSRMFIEVDKQVSVELLLKGVIIQSGNDASVALAEHIAGDESAFAGLMNQHAIRLGMSSTHFVNSTGLPAEDHYTTARDLAVVAAAMIRDHPEYYAWHALREFVFNDIKQHNRNRLLWRDDSVDGIKTGFTNSAGYCLVASAVRNEMRLISVVLGSVSEKIRAQESQALLNFGFRFYETHRLYSAGQPVTRVRVWKGESEELDVGLNQDLFVTVPRGQYEKIDARLELDTEITAPVFDGDTRGQVVLTLGEETVAERPLVALNDVPEGGLWRQLSDSVRLWFH